MLAAVRRIAEAVEVPVTADVEAGFGSTPEEVADTARAVIAAGAVGMNLEDGVEGKPDLLADVNPQKEIIQRGVGGRRERGRSLRAECAHGYFSDTASARRKRGLRARIERLNAYHAAGAQSLFAPGVKDKETIAQLARGVAGPLNILATVGTPPVAELQRARRCARKRRVRTDAGYAWFSRAHGSPASRGRCFHLDDRRRTSLRGRKSPGSTQTHPVLTWERQSPDWRCQNRLPRRGDWRSQGKSSCLTRRILKLYKKA